MWIQPVDTIELVIKGLLVGLIASAPMGPVGILTVQRTLNKGRWFGMVTGVGAAVSDLIYAAVSLIGISFVMEFIERPGNMLWLRLFGSLLLLSFGVYTYMTDPTKNMHVSGTNRGTLMHNAVTGFLVTFSNPLIVLLFMALMTRFNFVAPDHYWEQGLGYIAIFAGALLWWFGLTLVIDKVRERFHISTIRTINRVIGLVVIVASLLGLGVTFYMALGGEYFDF